ncbi:hypothetical protein RHMOL_Rhmol13G0063700 [Rhododendron molle]|uniref:Uncharacterized protein n=1 Tax=Rhododendron molle TaxID=49168 RepID=A0ACC0L3M7_RHOML|nr:hypothetical protein RHMOL_Rhmol13G0063700 [Rhododendron molle]
MIGPNCCPDAPANVFALQSSQTVQQVGVNHCRFLFQQLRVMEVNHSLSRRKYLRGLVGKFGFPSFR